jgi:hypothetical protein
VSSEVVVDSDGARANLIRVHYLVICVELTHQGALIIDYRGAHTVFSADYKVIIKATRVHVHPVGSMQLRPWLWRKKLSIVDEIILGM